MRIVFVLLFAIFAHAAYVANIVSVNGLQVKLNKSIQKGVSGIVLCPYQKEDIICARALAFGNYAKLLPYASLENSAFALPLVYPKKGDKIIFGKNYSRIMIIAPNQTDYLRLKNKFKKFTIIPVDVFAAFLNDLPTRRDFINFAKKMNIGLYIFAFNDKIYFVDAYSFYVIAQESFQLNNKFKLPFYSSYNFDISKKNIEKYYEKMLKGLND